MKRKWAIYAGGKFVDSGTIEAESDKDGLAQVMLDQDGKLDGGTSYNFTCGELSGSSYGDELRRSARAAVHGIDETRPMDGPHHFKPKLKDFGIDEAEVGGDLDARREIRSYPNLPGRGPNRIVGRALQDGMAGDLIPVAFDPAVIQGGGTYKMVAGDTIAINEHVRIGADGRLYLPISGPTQVQVEFINDEARFKLKR